MSSLEDPKNLAHRSQQRFRLPAGARQIILVRHGASIGQTVDTLDLGELTLSDPVLSPDGHVQAKALAAAYRDEPVSRLFVTPLRRTHQTAEPLSRALNMATESIDELREVHLGDWEHVFYEHAAAGNPLIREMYARESWDVIPNAEPMVEFGDRLRRGVEKVAAQTAPGETSIAFSHGAAIAEICRQATQSRPFAFISPENSSVSRLIVNADGSWRLRSFNDVSHLRNC